ncbi:pancreatic triacylglycerol lipase-like isoform X2 [Athalia rosae]|uniref:pancreatic triacylglycerol lipase-like isoform X2 n=1 Tax=Athalia rosae TaxID=37344 RepID=UPI002033D391|nr:pancreatic triacylglycerol lipase-like isoform X2 [Athalia rosae]
MRYLTVLVSWLTIFVAPQQVRSDATRADVATSFSDLDRITLRLYLNNKITDYVTVLIGDALDLLGRMNPRRKTILYFHGWTESPDSLSAVTVSSAHCRRGHNVIAVNWNVISARDYATAAYSVVEVGKTVAKAFNEMVASGLNASLLHVVSHSMGSQVAGAFGRHSDYGVRRITGLDPAGPGFHALIPDLSYKDAEFVDIIHTDGGIYGNERRTGTVDFWPNGGTRFQPGCPSIYVPLTNEDFCNHYRSWYFYSESVLNETAFLAVECPSKKDFESGLCDGNAVTLMGHGTPATIAGNFHLQTNGDSPFGKGYAGTKFVSSGSTPVHQTVGEGVWSVGSTIFYRGS